MRSSVRTCDLRSTYQLSIEGMLIVTNFGSWQTYRIFSIKRPVYLKFGSFDLRFFEAGV